MTRFTPLTHRIALAASVVVVAAMAAAAPLKTASADDQDWRGHGRWQHGGYGNHYDRYASPPPYYAPRVYYYPPPPPVYYAPAPVYGYPGVNLNVVIPLRSN
jgi:hypothetical protein